MISCDTCLNFNPPNIHLNINQFPLPLIPRLSKLIDLNPPRFMIPNSKIQSCNIHPNINQIPHSFHSFTFISIPITSKNTYPSVQKILVLLGTCEILAAPSRISSILYFPLAITPGLNNDDFIFIYMINYFYILQ